MKVDLFVFIVVVLELCRGSASGSDAHPMLDNNKQQQQQQQHSSVSRL